MSAPKCTGPTGRPYDALGACEARDCPVHAKARHTPGPWQFDPLLCELTGLWRVRFADNIPGLPENERKLGVAVLGSEANARLIAAAPELLEALKELVNRCDSEDGIVADGSNIQTMQAHAAIRKAEGVPNE